MASPTTSSLPATAGAAEARRWRVAVGGVAALGVLVCLLEVAPRVAELYGDVRAWRANATLVITPEEATARLAALQRERAEVESALGEVLARETEASGVLLLIDEYAGRAEATVIRVEPGEPRALGQQEVVPVEVVLSGDFHEIGRFVAYAESGAAPLRVLGLRLEREASGAVGATVQIEHLRSLSELDAPRS